MGSRSLPSRPTVSPKPSPPDRSGRHQKSAIAPFNSPWAGPVLCHSDAPTPNDGVLKHLFLAFSSDCRGLGRDSGNGNIEGGFLGEAAPHTPTQQSYAGCSSATLIAGPHRRSYIRGHLPPPSTKIFQRSEITASMQNEEIYAFKLLAALAAPELPSIVTTAWISARLGVAWRSLSRRLLARSGVQQALAVLGWRYQPALGCKGGRFVRTEPDKTPELERALGLPWATISAALLFYETCPMTNIRSPRQRYPHTPTPTP
jgi:hypothetical protein